MGEQHAPLRLWQRALAGSERVCVRMAHQEQWKGTFKNKGSDGPIASCRARIAAIAVQAVCFRSELQKSHYSSDLV